VHAFSSKSQDTYSNATDLFWCDDRNRREDVSKVGAVADDLLLARQDDDSISKAARVWIGCRYIYLYDELMALQFYHI
jgi:hypothetical protein